jgi:hypothetical protein
MRFAEGEVPSGGRVGAPHRPERFGPLRAFDDVAQQFPGRIRYFVIFIERGEQP